MNMQKLHVMLIATSLLAGCASQPVPTQKAANASAASSAATAASPVSTATAASPATAAGTEDDGPFRKIVRDGKTLYCDNGDRLGSRMARPRCLTEDQYAAWKENNRNTRDELDRVRDSAAGAARTPGPGAGGR